MLLLWEVIDLEPGTLGARGLKHLSPGSKLLVRKEEARKKRRLTTRGYAALCGYACLLLEIFSERRTQVACCRRTNKTAKDQGIKHLSKARDQTICSNDM